MKRIILKTISIITVSAFLCTNCFDLAYSVERVSDRDLAASSSLPVADYSVQDSSVRPLDINSFELPETLGTIKDSWQSPNVNPEVPNVEPKAPTVILSDSEGSQPNSKQLVIHIQDAHCNYSCQKQISEIINYVNTKYGVDTLNLEGGAEDYDISIFTNVEDKVKREKAADHFVKMGLVNGAEYYAINNPEKVTLWGVEDVDLYINNLKVYRNSLENQKERDAYLEELNSAIKQLKTKIFNPALMEISIKQAAYKEGNLDFKDYVVFLADRADSSIAEGVSNEGVRPQSGVQSVRRGLTPTTPNIAKLDEIIANENFINFKRADAERSYLIDEFKTTLSKYAMEDLAKKTISFKNSEMKQEEYYAYLINTAKDFKVDLTAYPELTKYIEYINAYNEIDKSAVFEEIKELEKNIKNSLFENKEQKELDAISTNLNMLSNIFNISISRKDWNEYSEVNRETYSIERYKSFIATEAPKYGISINLSEGIEKIDTWRNNIEDFYKYSFARDEAFLNNLSKGESRTANVILRSKATKDPSPTKNSTQPKESNGIAPTILITGGFHADNLFDHI
ncbi:MAG: hypothetical protein HQL29_05600 [Candidatus Omnitrophica bacterium]|nr:hypothetical protein [Candidatus Omnitrophota bacterium]